MRAAVGLTRLLLAAGDLPGGVAVAEAALSRNPDDVRLTALRCGVAVRGGASTAGRLQFDGATQHVDMLRQYGAVDIALDPFPFCGGLTSCEALWMGVPIVTRVESQLFARQTQAILHAIGRPERSAGSDDAYVEIAARLAGDAAALNQLRRNLRGQIVASGFGDAARFARGLARAYHEMWRRYVEQLPINPAG